jgi:hypothetical protein
VTGEKKGYYTGCRKDKPRTILSEAFKAVIVVEANKHKINRTKVPIDQEITLMVSSQIIGGALHKTCHAQQ